MKGKREKSDRWADEFNRARVFRVKLYFWDFSDFSLSLLLSAYSQSTHHRPVSLTVQASCSVYSRAISSGRLDYLLNNTRRGEKLEKIRKCSLSIVFPSDHVALMLLLVVGARWRFSKWMTSIDDLSFLSASPFSTSSQWGRGGGEVNTTKCEFHFTLISCTSRPFARNFSSSSENCIWQWHHRCHTGKWIRLESSAHTHPWLDEWVPAFSSLSFFLVSLSLFYFVSQWAVCRRDLFSSSFKLNFHDDHPRSIVFETFGFFSFAARA